MAAIAWAGVARSGSRPIVVAVDATSDVAGDDVRRAVAAELGAVVAGPLDAAPESAERLEVSSRNGMLHVTFRDGHGRTLTREVSAPQGGADRVRLIALLAGNLARNEAEELAKRAGVDVKGVTVRAAPGEVVRVEIDARDVPGASSSVARAAPTPEPAEDAPPAPTAPRLAWTSAPVSRRGSSQRTAGWITFGGSLAAGGAGLVLGVTAQAAAHDLTTTCAPSCTASRMDAVRSRWVVADMLLGIGALGTVTGIVLVLTAPSATAPVAVEVDGRTIGLVGTF